MLNYQRVTLNHPLAYWPTNVYSKLSRGKLLVIDRTSQSGKNPDSHTHGWPHDYQRSVRTTEPNCPWWALQTPNFPWWALQTPNFPWWAFPFDHVGRRHGLIVISITSSVWGPQLRGIGPWVWPTSRPHTAAEWVSPTSNTPQSHRCRGCATAGHVTSGQSFFSDHLLKD